MAASQGTQNAQTGDTTSCVCSQRTQVAAGSSAGRARLFKRAELVLNEVVGGRARVPLLQLRQDF